MTVSQVMDLTVVSQNFPILPEPQIPRENILQTLETVLAGDTEVIFVEGDPGSGKTTLLGQFALAHPMQAIALFVRVTSRWAYDPLILKVDLCNQLSWILNREELGDSEELDDAFLRTSLTRLARRAKRNRETYYFLLDGLEEIPEDDSSIRQSILQMLPFGNAHFRFLISGDAELYTNDLHEGLKRKPFILTGFTLDQTHIYLSDMGFTRRDLEETHKICGGNPGHLASIRRIVKTGTDKDKLLAEMPRHLPGLFEIEWRAVDTSNEWHLLALAIIAHDRRPHSANELARLLGVEEESIRQLAETLTFLSCNSGTGEVAFVAEAFRQFAVSKLSGSYQRVHELLIAELKKEPISSTSLTYLPGYLEKLGLYKELVSYLGLENLMHMLEQGQALGLIRQKLGLGLTASKKANRHGEHIRFALQDSAMRAVGDIAVWRSEVEALMVLDEYEPALALVQSMISPEDRLHLLAVIARKKHERGLSIEAEVDDQIIQLCRSMDASNLGEQAVEIAADLLATHPDLAIELVERSMSTAEDANAMDWAMAQLSFRALGHEQEVPTGDVAERIRQRINDPQVRGLSSTATILLREHSAEEVIAEARNLASASDQLYLLRLWAVDNREREDAWKVSDYGLQLILQTPDYAPNARVFRELALPLPHVIDLALLEKLIGRFDAQKSAIERSGPTEEYVRLELLIAQGEKPINSSAACNRLIEIYHYVIATKDLTTKTSCLARLVAALARIDPDHVFDPDTGIHTISESDLHESIDLILLTTASHYETTRGVVRALAKTRPELALSICERLNTEPRRDKVRLEFVESATRNSVSHVDFGRVVSAINDIRDPAMVGSAILKCVARLAASKDVSGETLTEAMPLVGLISRVDNAGMRCNAYALAHRLLLENGGITYSDLADNILIRLEDSWSAIDPGFVRVDIGFKTAELLAKNSNQLARTYVKLANEVRDAITIDSSEAATALDQCLRLASRVLGGLIRARIASSEDLDRLKRLIEEFDSSGQRAILWGELALHYYMGGQYDNCSRIVVEHVKPLLANLSPQDSQYCSRVMISVAPALYCAHKSTAKELIYSLVPQHQDEAWSAICNFLLRKTLPSDPYDSMPGASFDLSYEEIVDLCELVGEMRADHVGYHYLTLISSSVQSGKKKLTSEQRLDVASRLRVLVDSKFPNDDFIRHKGYQVIGLAQVARIESKQAPRWDQLQQLAMTIDNKSDRAYVFSQLATAMPKRDRPAQKRLLQEAALLVTALPSVDERARRFADLAVEAAQIDLELSRGYIRNALKCSEESDSRDVKEMQREIIDFTHRLDPEFAASLVSLVDDDRMARRLRRRLEILEFLKQIAQRDSQNHSTRNYPQAFWQLLGRLNAGRITTVHQEQLQDYVRMAADISLTESYPIYSFVIQNAIRRWASSTSESAMHLRPFFDAMVEGALFAIGVGTRSSQVLQRAKRRTSQLKGSNSILVQPGEREQGIEFLRKWIEESVSEYLKICDPYFGPGDLEVLQLLLTARKRCRVHILSSIEHNRVNVDEPWETSYGDYWRIHISDQDPPDTEIVVAGIGPRLRLPIHDRWWLTNGSGLRMGTSYNGLGLSRASEISILSRDEAADRESEVDQYLNRTKREQDGMRLQYRLWRL